MGNLQSTTPLQATKHQARNAAERQHSEDVLACDPTAVTECQQTLDSLPVEIKIKTIFPVS